MSVCTSIYIATVVIKVCAYNEIKVLINFYKEYVNIDIKYC